MTGSRIDAGCHETITSRKRVEAALNFQAVDRVPQDLNLSFDAYCRLAEAVGFNAPLPKPSLAMEVCPDPAFYEKLDIDVYSVKFGMGATFDGTFKERVTDAWGIGYRLVGQQSGRLYEVCSHPLADAEAGDLESYPWPDAPTGEMKKALREEVKRIYETTGLALCGRFGAPVMEVAVGLLGFEEWFVRLLTEPDFTKALLEKIESIATAWDLAGIEACGEYLSILKVSGEDFGSQQSLLYSPETIRDFLLPILKRRWDAVHGALDACGSGAKVMLHTCGAVKPIIPDLIVAGIEVLDPIQPKASGMNPSELHAAFGSRLAFHGGIDVQDVLPTGTPEQVRAHVAAVIAALHGRNGGFILAPSHTVQADVPVENILAFMDALREE
jgi:uroporphyrinogen decarboxylase